MSNRRGEIIRLAKIGKTNVQIAAELCIKSSIVAGVTRRAGIPPRVAPRLRSDRNAKRRDERAKTREPILAAIRDLAARGYYAVEIAEKVGVKLLSVQTLLWIHKIPAEKPRNEGVKRMLRLHRPERAVETPRIDTWQKLLAGRRYEDDPTAPPSEGPWRGLPPPSATGNSSMAYA